MCSNALEGQHLMHPPTLKHGNRPKRGPITQLTEGKDNYLGAMMNQSPSQKCRIYPIMTTFSTTMSTLHLVISGLRTPNTYPLQRVPQTHTHTRNRQLHNDASVISGACKHIATNKHYVRTGPVGSHHTMEHAKIPRRLVVGIQTADRQ